MKSAQLHRYSTRHPSPAHRRSPHAAPGSVWSLCAAPWQLARPLAPANAGATLIAIIPAIRATTIIYARMRLISARFTDGGAINPTSS